MTPIKSFCLFIVFCLLSPTASAVISSTPIQATASMRSSSTQKQVSKTTKTAFFQKQLIKKKQKRAENRGTTEGVTAALLGLASIISFGIGAAQTGFLSELAALFFYAIGIVFAVLFLIFLIRWGMNQNKNRNFRY